MIYALLIIIAIGVLLLSEGGKRFLGWLSIVAVIYGVYFFATEPLATAKEIIIAIFSEHKTEVVLLVFFALVIWDYFEKHPKDPKKEIEALIKKIFYKK